ncbi:MAG: response regulator, partial [Gorillibacterium sp.]|nr:response regulator [Gorillibacterium sp.]
MGFKKKQFLGYGVILFLMLLLLTVAIMMLNILKDNMNEITNDRFGKVDIITDIRAMVYSIDSEMALMLNNRTNVQQHLDSLEAERRSVIIQIENLRGVVDTADGIVSVNTLKADFDSYSAIQLEFMEMIRQENWDAASKILREKNQQVILPLVKTTGDFIALQKDLMAKRVIAYEKNHTLTISLIVATSLLFIIISIIIAGWVIRSTTRSLVQVIDGMSRVDVSLPGSLPRLNITSHDEIGAISTAFNRMVEQLENYRENELVYNAEIQRQNWMQQQISDVATMYQGIMDLNSLAERFINKATPLVGAVYGVMYVAKGNGREHHYEKLASYAADGEEIGRNSIAPGQGLIGQCARDQRLMRLDDVPINYVQISSGLGASPAKHVLVAPILFAGRTVAVVEFASLNRFSEMDEALIISLTERMGITVDNISGRVEVERLLIESQTLTEELQTQSEELHAQALEMQMQSEELRVSNEQLEGQNELIQQRSVEVNKIRRELVEKNQDLEQNSSYKTDFLANMSHELRTPLNSILILSQMLMENRQGSLDSEEKEFSQVIYNSGNDLLSLINDILDLSKVEAGKMTLELRDINVLEIPKVLSWNFGLMAEKKALRLLTEVDPNVPSIIHSDEQRVHQVLKNLISNAIKFTEHGTITIKVYQPSLDEIIKVSSSEGNPWINDAILANGQVQVKPLADYVAFAIVDTGIGVVKSQQSLIFEAFRQADGATSRKYGGTGLGLSICREFASILGGYVGMESEEDKGSTFTFYVPIHYPGHNDDVEPGNLSNPNASIEVVLQGVEDDLYYAMREVGATNKLTAAEVQYTHADQVLPQDKIDSRVIDALPTKMTENGLFKDRRVLIVDDDVRNVFAISTALENQGMTVTTAMNGRNALDELKRDANYDLILMDIMMPEMDGYETMKIIRHQLGLEKIPIIALTAKAMKSDREKCLAAGASDYIS